MPSDDYATVARGPLKLKGVVAGGKVKKHKKKKDKTDLEKNLSTGDSKSPVTSNNDDDEKQLQRRDAESLGADIVDSQDEERTRRATSQSQEREEDDETKTEAERRFLEAKRKRLKEMMESGRVRPELLKTHKQRVEELNAHLSRLSEHHDMPKIGPG